MIFEFLINAIILLVKIILFPIDALIATVLPSLSEGLSAVGEFIEYMALGLGWAISAAGIPYAALSLIATFYIFKLTLPVNIWLMKLGIKWWRTLKP